MKIARLIILLALIPLSALLSSWIYTYLWDLALAKQYGTGPSYQSWYGIGVIVHLVRFKMPVDSDEKGSLLVKVLIPTLTFYATAAIVVLLTLMTFAILGWH